MHGLILATWEKFLEERYGEVILGVYRSSIIGEARFPLVTRVYPDEVFYSGIVAIAETTGLPPDVLLREYGRFFITSAFTSHVCTHVLEHIHTARDLLLAMRVAHLQMHHALPEVTPPLFRYEPLTGDGIRIIYDSNRKLCSMLGGIIEGTGMRYGEEISIQEVTCMKDGKSESCQFDINFLGKCGLSAAAVRQASPASPVQRRMAEIIFAILPSEGIGITLFEISRRMHLHYGHFIRPGQVVTLMRQLQNVGLAIVSAKQAGDIFYQREYLRISKFELSGAERLLVVNVL